MIPSRAMIAAAFIPLAAASPALAQGPCDLVFKQAAHVMGAPAGRSERLKPTATTEVCNVRSADSAAAVRLTVSADRQPGQTMMVQKMIAQKTADRDQTFREEPALGLDAFSLREKDQVTFFVAGSGRVIAAGLTKDAGVTDADAERARQFAKQLLAAK
jgi:hypothetical protein